MEEKKTTRAAVVIFVEVDQDIPAHHAGFLVSQALGAKGILKEGLSVSRGDITWDIQIHDVMEAGMAMGNGYLWTEVTSKAYPRKEEDED